MNRFLQFIRRSWPVLILCLIAAGCNSESKTASMHLTVFLGGDQFALPGEPFAQPLYIRADDGRSLPLAGQKLKIEIPAGSDLQVSAAEATTDAGGLARFDVTAGRQTGDNYLKVIPAAAPEQAIAVRFVTGVQLLGVEQEGRAGNLLPQPVGLKLVNASGVPLPGVPVYLTTGTAENPQVTALTTDETGEASTELRLPATTGAAALRFDLPTGELDNPVRSIAARVLAINYYTLLINVLGGLAIFVFGMKLMSDGLTKIAGERMRSILHFCAGNRFVAVLAGTLVTAVIQSSSATTVMVIGFVNAGLLSLAQSIGIIFGANIGTTITAQIVAFDVGALAMPAIIIGLLLMFITWQKLRGWGDTVLGFGLLFFGMALMSADLKSIGTFPSFIAFFRTFDCAPVDGFIPFGPLLGAIGIGLLVTLIIQSSSAATGVIIALGASGLINLYTAVALVLGSNIGTTITAQLAAIPANRVAKQAALAHTLFNTLGVLLVISTFWFRWGDSGIPVFFYLVDWMTNGDAFAALPQNVPRHIANAHTLFNLLTTLLLLPFVGTLAAVCRHLLPVGTRKVKYQSLEPHLLDNPALALEQADLALQKMLKKSWKMVQRTILEHFLPLAVDKSQFASLKRQERRIDRYQLEIMEYLSQIMRRELSEAQSAAIPPLMHCTNDAERIADRAGNMFRLALRLKESGNTLSKEAAAELKQIFKALNRQAAEAFAALQAIDDRRERPIQDREPEILHLAEKFADNHIARLNKGTCQPVTGIIFVELLTEFTAVSRHLTNIIERVPAIRVQSVPAAAEPKTSTRQEVIL
ncbi:Na/Pi symporter [Victivallis sp. Marseille-Q1083]|uniref:Na/Pi symporter n=1 Tax=Victivallis sp. Marseille-Q1083 TaxID=2717288 RepID=UPI001588BB8B|nr:Na/Pi symporter [Victivallis sp. Marseille-Q1083]